MSSAAFHEIQYKASSGQVNLDQAQGIVECFVAGIGNKDSVGDVCATGAFTKSLMRRKPRVVWGHNWNDPIGKVIEIYEVPASDPRLPAKMKAAGIGGLYAKVQFNLNSEKGREAFANVAFFGEEQEWSIGYKTLRAQFDPNVQANILYEVELYEVSPVLHGANQLTGTISVKSDEKGGMMPMVITPVGQPSDDERPMQEGMERKLEEELSMRLGSPVKVLKTDSGVVYFTRQDSDSENSKYKCRYHMGDDGVFMFGRPERFEIPRQMPSQQPVQRTQPGMPSKPMASAPGAAPVVVPNLVPGATPASPPMVRFNYDGGDAPSSSMPVKPKLVDEERDLAEALIKITKRYGKFNEDSTGVWAGYKPAAENPVAKIGVKCSNCVLYEGNGKCKIVAQQVEPEGKCRFAVIPDGVVSMGPVQKASFDASSSEEEVKWLEEIEEKYPGEFISGVLRGTLKRRRKRKLRSKTVFMLSEYSEKSLEDFSDFDMAEVSYVLPIDPDKAFEVKQLIDPIIDFHRVDAYVEDGGIVFTNGVTHDFVEAVGAAVNGPFFQSEKALGRNLAGKFQRGRGLAARFDPYAWDGDNDGMVQEGTPFERPAIPGLNDFASRGRINLAAARKIQGQWNASSQDRGGSTRAAERADLPAPSPDTSLASGKSSNPTARKLDEIIDGHDDKWDLDKTDQEFSDYLDTLDPDETADALAEIQQQQRINEAQAREAGVLEDDVVGDDFTSIVNRLMSDYDMDEFDAEEEGARLLDSYDEYRRRREHYLTAAKAAKRRMRGSGAIRNTTSRDALSSGRKRSLTRHSSMGAANEAKFSNNDENAMRESHEDFIKTWEDGMGLPFTTIDRQSGEKGPRFTEDWMRGREVGYNDAKARWMGKGTSKRPPKVDDRQRSSTDYASWYMDVVGQLGRDKRDRDSRDPMPGYDNDGTDAGIRTFLNEVSPTPESREIQAEIDKTLKDAGFESRMSLSSGRDLSSSRVEDEAKLRINREAFEKRVVFGLSLEEVAEEMGMTRAEVRQAEMRHLDRIRNMKGDEFNEEVYRLRQEAYSLEDAAKAFGKSREEIRQAEMRHSAKLRDLPEAEKDAAIFRDRTQNDINGRQMSLDEVAKKYGVSVDEARRSELREAKRQRDLEQTRPRRELRRERNASGSRAAQGGAAVPPKFTKSVFDKYDTERRSKNPGLFSGSDQNWVNPSDGLPASINDWSDNDWDTYYSREMIARERRGVRPLGNELAYGLREDLSDRYMPKPDGSRRKAWFAHTSDMGAAVVTESDDGTFSAQRLVFDDYEGYYTDDFDYDIGYGEGGFDSPEAAAKWLSEKIDSEEQKGFINGSEQDSLGNRLSASKGSEYTLADIAADEKAREDAWANYYKDIYPDGKSTGNGLSSGKGPYTAGQRITRQINKKRPPRTDYDYSGDGKYLPTEEQMTAIDAVMTGENVVIPALAGSGKTSTLVSLAKRMAKEQPDKKLVYLAFNRSAANDAERRFRGIPNVQVMTLDSVGRRWMSQRKNGKSFIDRIGSEDVKAGKELTAKNLAKEFKLNTEVVQGREVSGDQIASLAINAVEKFEISGDDSIGLQHFVDDKDQQIPADQLPSNVFDIANRLWNDKTSEDGEFLISYNTLTKMWQSSNPDFASSGTGPDGAKDLVLFDESQDLNPVWNKAASAMSIQRVYVGDPNQAIYGFRGAVNELDSISEKEPYVLPLTEVFRFGPEIASVGNRVLSLLGIDSNRMVGRGGAGSVVDSGSMENPDLIIARTNGGVIRSALEMIDNGKSIGTTQRAKKELDLMINSISRLRFNNPTGQDHPDLAEFTSFEDLKKAVEEKVANRKQSTLYRLMTEISLTDLRRVQKGMQVWDPADDGETAKDSEIVDLALSAAKDDPKIGDMIRSIASQFGKRELSPKQWAVLERASGKKREGGQPVMGLDIKKPSSISPGASGKLTSNIDYNVVGDRVELSGRGTMGAKEQIKAAGFRWDGTKKVWHTPSSRADEAFDQLSGGGGAAGKKASKPDVVILTSHLSKGLEMDNVKLANDFWGPERDEETGETVWPDEEHMHAVYVALTRAKKSLDPGGADWVFDWTDDSDGEPNTSREFGLSSGKKAAKKMQRRPWTEEERQAFADGQRLRAQTIQGKRRGSAPDDMRDAGRAGGRRERRGLSSGVDSSDVDKGRNPAGTAWAEREIRESRAETGSTEISRALSARDKSKEKLPEGSRAPKADDLEASNTGFEDTGETSAPTTRRRAAGGTRVGAGETARQEFGKISTDKNGNEVFTPDPDVKERIRAGKKKKSIKIKNISDNDKRNPGDEWLVDASKLREVFTDSSGKQLSDEMIADVLGISVDDVKEWDAPGAGVSETEVSDMIEKAKGVRDLGQLMPEDVMKVWGYDAAPGWIDSQTGEKISRPEFESMQRAGNLRGIQPYTEYDLMTEDELAEAKPIEQIREERLIREASKRSNYSATTLARSLGVIGESDRLDDSNTDAFIEKLRELGIDAQPRTIKETWVTGGMPLQVLRQLEGDGHISIPDVYKMESSPSTIAKIDATQSVVDALEKAGLNETQIGRVINYWTGTRNPTALKKHREAMEKGGKARTGAEGSLGRNDLQQRIDEANKIIKENGFNVPELSVDSIMGKPTSADVPEVDAGNEPSSPPKFVPLPRDPRGNYDFSKFSDKEIADQVSARKYYIRQLQNAENGSVDPKTKENINGLSGQKLKEARARRGRYQAELNALEMVATRRLASRRTRAPKSQSEKSLQALDNVSFRKQKAEENTHGRTKGARAMGSKRLVSL